MISVIYSFFNFTAFDENVKKELNKHEFIFGCTGLFQLNNK